MARGRMPGRGLRRAAVPLLAALLCACASTPFEERSWQVVESRHFLAFTEGDAGPAGRLLADLERFRTGLHWLLRLPKDAMPDRTRVVLFHDVATAGEALPDFTVGWADRTAHGGLIVSVSSLYERFEREVMHHEYVHVVRAVLGEKTPRWYQEGIAETLSTLENEDGVLVIGRTPLRIRYSERLRRRWGIGGASIRGMLTDEAPPLSILDTYADYWLLTHYLLFRHEPAQLDEYLRRWRRGEHPVEAFEIVFGDVGDFQVNELAPYGRSTRRPMRKIRVGEALAFDATSRVRPAEPGEVDALFRDVRAVLEEDEDGAAKGALR